MSTSAAYIAGLVAGSLSQHGITFDRLDTAATEGRFEIAGRTLGGRTVHVRVTVAES